MATPKQLKVYGLNQVGQEIRFNVANLTPIQIRFAEKVFLCGTGVLPMQTTPKGIARVSVGSADRSEIKDFYRLLEGSYDIVKRLAETDGQARVRYSGLRWLVQDLHKKQNVTYYKQHFDRCRFQVEKVFGIDPSGPEMNPSKTATWRPIHAVVLLGHIISGLSIRGNAKILTRPWLPYVGAIALIKYHPVLIEGIVEGRDNREINLKALYRRPYNLFPKAWEKDVRVKYA